MPGHVRLAASRIGGAVTVNRQTDVHAGKEVTLEIPVPSPPFVVALHLDTFSPAQFGKADTRRLGAQLSFTYPG